LAEAFQQKGFDPVFVVRKRPSIKDDSLPFRILWLEETSDAASADPASWKVGTELTEADEMTKLLSEKSFIILDHYSLGEVWQMRIKSLGHRIALFQDLFSESFSADVLVNYNVPAKNLYRDTVRKFPNTKFLLGPSFSPLSKEYEKEHRQRFNPQVEVRTVGISLGGSDPKYLEVLAMAIAELEEFKNISIEWVVNSKNEKALLDSIFSPSDLKIHVRLPSLMPLYKRVDLFIGTCGISYLERACLGLWQMNFVVAENQVEIASAIKDVLDLRAHGKVPVKAHLKKLFNLRNTAEARDEINSGFNQVDGQGSQRLCNSLTEVMKT
jgi:spore coat polysaccharide biosynthesis predicted glycosyltransferase SpsG